MRLAEYTDYTLRVLMYCAARPGERVTIRALAEHHGVSRNHLMKVVNDLGRRGVMETTRGRGGGVRLVQDPRSIHLGELVRASETDFRLVECFDAATNRCGLTPDCRLKGVLADAMRAFFDVLDRSTLAEIAGPAPAAPEGGAMRPRRIPLPERRGAGGPAGH
jgi:Rrf2 family nitric oxide-sensitive transcriptional repressor